jgi:hypothetical protein
VPNFPRPLGATRTLTAEMAGIPYGMRMYETKSPPEAVIAAYDKSLTADGWNMTSGAEDEPNSRAYFRGGDDVMVIAEALEGKTMISVVNMVSK